MSLPAQGEPIFFIKNHYLVTKNDFANRITEDIDLSKDDFKNFEPLFNAIRCIISNVDEKMFIKDDM